MSTLAPLDIPIANLVAQTASFVPDPLSTNLVDTTAGAVEATLPDSDSCVGRGIVIFLQVKGGSNNCTVTSTENINGSGSDLTLSSANTAYVLLSVGSALGGWLALSGLLAQ